MRRPLLLTALAALALAAGGCGGSESEEAGEGGQATIAGATVDDHGTMDVAGMDEISLELDDDYFEPTVLEGTPGQQLKIELENEGGNEHNFSIDAQSIDQDVDPDGKATVTVTFPESGEVGFYCKYHRDAGMAGALETSG